MAYFLFIRFDLFFLHSGTAFASILWLVDWVVIYHIEGTSALKLFNSRSCIALWRLDSSTFVVVACCLLSVVCCLFHVWCGDTKSERV
ncbi:MAG: hypothetical protein BYD32DRAFT_404916 [Podila humilis]|nr:MAG: hypothetical protein BYD32DRAFT_404916 [Podila humilis]